MKGNVGLESVDCHRKQKNVSADEQSGWVYGELCFELEQVSKKINIDLNRNLLQVIRLNVDSLS